MVKSDFENQSMFLKEMLFRYEFRREQVGVTSTTAKELELRKNWKPTYTKENGGRWINK